MKTLMAQGTRTDIVELWRRAVLGDASARRAMLARILPGSEQPAAAPVIEFAPAAGRQRDRAA